MIDFSYFFLSILAYFIYLILAWSLGLPSTDNPNNSLCKAHLYFGLILGAGAMCHGWVTDWSIGSPWSLAIGFTMYFFYHYAIALNFFLLATRSVSSNLLATLTQLTDPVSVTELYTAYADKKGFEFVRQDRLKWMLHRGLIQQIGTNLVLTDSGSKSADLSQRILKIWGLVQIGSKTKDSSF